MVNIVIPMAGRGQRFQEAGYVFPKPIIDINGKTMIEIVINNLRPKTDHKFIFICQRDHYEKYDIHNVLKKASKNNFETILINGITEGAACTVLTAIQHINNDQNLIIANSDQYIAYDINKFIKKGKKDKTDGLIMTFSASHPKWSYARVDKDGQVKEVAEKKVISDHATVGIYFYKKGSDFVKGAESMIHKNVRTNNEFYVAPVFNEMILDNKNIYIDEISAEFMHGLGTPEDLKIFMQNLADKKIKLK